MNQRVLIAGCGDVGMRAAKLLRARGDTVFALRRTAASDGADGIRWLQGDLSIQGGLGALPAVDQVVYTATPDRRDEAAYRRTFIDGPGLLLDALDRNTLSRVLFVSSSAVYGDHAGAWVDEDTPAAPPGFNGQVLLDAERALVGRGVSTTVLRLAGLYGPGRTELFGRLREGKVRVPRQPPFFSNRIHVDDAAAAIAHLLALPDVADCYLGVDDTPLEMAVLYDHLAGLLGAPLAAAGDPPGGIGSKRLSNARLRAGGFRCRWPDARDGYAALIDSQPL
jgi:nucleoside-diphosphate-sugar epimerase